MSAEALGLPIFGREISSLARRPRTYVFQTAFLTVLVLAILPLWPSGGAQSGADVAETGRMIFEWGGYLQLILLALLAPAITANAITQEKERGTLDLLLLTQAGPFAIVVGKFTSRLFNLLFLLFLTLPLLFALLTLGGFAGSTLLQEIVILLGFAILGSGLGTLLSTILAKPTAALGAGYALVAVALGVPEVLRTVGALGAAPGGFQPLLARVDPLHDLIYVFHPTWFLVTSSQPTGWWVCPSGTRAWGWPSWRCRGCCSPTPAASSGSSACAARWRRSTGRPTPSSARPC